MECKNRNQCKSEKPGPESLRYLLQDCGISLTALQVRQLWSYHQLLRSHNEELNLTRIHNFKNMALKLYADSILPGQLMDLPSPLLDLGSGAGMPGVPLRIAFPHLDIVLAESRQNRVNFLLKVCEQLRLDNLKVISRTIHADFQEPTAGVISRAVEDIASTLERIQGCLAVAGKAIFMKGPNCDPEIEAALQRYQHRYRLLQNLPYSIPGTPHQRRLVVFQRIDEPVWALKAEAMKRYSVKQIESEQNDIYKDLKKLLTARGVKKQNRALLSGQKQVQEILRDYPQKCEAWISSGETNPPPPIAPGHLAWYQLNPRLFEVLDVFGTHSPLLLLRIEPLPGWTQADGLPMGCSVLVPFQDPENVGALIRSAAAFGASQVILLAEAAHPYHPKALRASGGAVLGIKILQGPALHDLTEDLPLVPLSVTGKSIADFVFPDAFALLPGLEGPGIPDKLKPLAVSIPIASAIESLNASVAAAIALYAWVQSKPK